MLYPIPDSHTGFNAVITTAVQPDYIPGVYNLLNVEGLLTSCNFGTLFPSQTPVLTLTNTATYPPSYGTPCYIIIDAGVGNIAQVTVTNLGLTCGSGYCDSVPMWSGNNASDFSSPTTTFAGTSWPPVSTFTSTGRFVVVSPLYNHGSFDAVFTPGFRANVTAFKPLSATAQPMGSPDLCTMSSSMSSLVNSLDAAVWTTSNGCQVGVAKHLSTVFCVCFIRLECDYCWE
jgi:hypothetical protein